MPDKPVRAIDMDARLQRVKKLLPESLQHPAVLALIQLSLAEDLSAQADLAALGDSPAEADVTSLATLSPESRLEGRINAKASGIVAGLPVAAAVYQLVDPNIHFKANAVDGERVDSGRLLAEVRGSGGGLLAGERTALNFLGRLSGIASLTRMFVDAIAGTNTVILDTRKTAPGLRYLDKYAVRMGGGQNHRTGLFDMVLIKDNHIDGAGGIETAVQRVRKMYGGQYQIEVEVKNLDELEQALRLQVDRIMLDNMDLETMRIAVVTTNKRIPLEASGNVTLTSVRKIAETGVDYISSGALTHSAPVLDISMRLK